jgi:hypothetical protein
MSFFDWVYLIDAVAMVTIAALVLTLSIQRRADDSNSDMSTIARAMFKRAPRSEAQAQAASLRARLGAHLRQLRQSLQTIGSLMIRGQSERT